jgi:plasmid stabilization system protein ParE
MKARFLEVAEAELTDAVEYYDGEAPGLGDRLVAEVRATVELLEENPEIGPVVRGSLRKRAVSAFPYTIYYVVEGREIQILALAHQRRRPGYWWKRLQR